MKKYIILFLASFCICNAQGQSYSEQLPSKNVNPVDRLDVVTNKEIPSFIVITKTVKGFIEHNQIFTNPTVPINLNSNIGSVECYEECISKSLLSVKLHRGGALNTIQPISTAWSGDYTVNFEILCNGVAITNQQTLQLTADKPEETFVIDITDRRSSRCNSTSTPVCNNMALRIISTSKTAPDACTTAIRLDTKVTESINRTPLSVATALKAEIASSNLAFTNIQHIRRISNNPVTFTWSEIGCNLDSASSYEIQVLRLYNTDPQITDENSILAKIDWTQALTIETGTTAKSITLNLGEGRGWYIWRVRPIYDVVPTAGGADSRNWGPYSDAPSSSTTATLFNSSSSDYPSGSHYLFFLRDENNYKYNYSYGKALTEGNEKGPRIAEAMVYADPLLNPIQKHDKIASENGAIVTQTVYDFAGRPIVQTIPSYVEKSDIGFSYIPNYIGNGSGVYGPKNISSTGVPDPMTSPNGPNLYYSNSNTDPMVPSASNYPFSATQFYVDGRLKTSTSGAGIEHRIGSTHSIKTFYSGVSEKELTSIFGKEAPDALSCAKVITSDPNGISSVQYINKYGKTIATCLKGGLGATDISGDAIPTITTEGNTTLRNLVGEKVNWLYGANAVKQVVEKGLYTTPTELTASTTMTFDSPTQLNLDYVFPYPQSFKSTGCDNCGCDYEVTITVKDVDNPNGDPLFHITKKDGFLLPHQCSPFLYDYNSTHSLTLNPGSYIIERKLTTNNPYILGNAGVDMQRLSGLEMYKGNEIQGRYDALKAELFGTGTTDRERLNEYIIKKALYPNGLPINVANPPLIEGGDCTEYLELPEPDKCEDLKTTCASMQSFSDVKFEEYLLQELLDEKDGTLVIAGDDFTTVSDIINTTNNNVTINRMFKNFSLEVSSEFSDVNGKYPMAFPAGGEYAGRVKQFTGWGLFNVLVWNMIEDMNAALAQSPPKSIGYTCEDLAESWMETVERYKLFRLTGVPNIPDKPSFEFDLLEEFMVSVFQKVAAKMNPVPPSFRRMTIRSTVPYRINPGEYGYLTQAHYVVPAKNNFNIYKDFLGYRCLDNAVRVLTNLPPIGMPNPIPGPPAPLPWEDPIWDPTSGTTFSQLNHTGWLCVKFSSNSDLMTTVEGTTIPQNECGIPMTSGTALTAEQAECLYNQAKKQVDQMKKECSKQCDKLNELFIYDLEKLYHEIGQYRRSDPRAMVPPNTEINEEEFLCRLSLLQGECKKGCTIEINHHPLYVVGQPFDTQDYPLSLQPLFTISNTEDFQKRMMGLYDIRFPSEGNSCSQSPSTRDYATNETSEPFHYIDKGTNGTPELRLIKVLVEFLNNDFKRWKADKTTPTEYPLATALETFRNLYFPPCEPGSTNPCCNDERYTNQRNALISFILQLSISSQLRVTNITNASKGYFALEDGAGNNCCRMVFKDKPESGYDSFVAQSLNEYMDDVWSHESSLNASISIPGTSTTEHTGNMNRILYHVKQTNPAYDHSQLSNFANLLITKLNTVNSGIYPPLSNFVNITGINDQSAQYSLLGSINTTVTDLVGWRSIPDSIADTLYRDVFAAYPPTWLEMGTISIQFPRTSLSDPIRKLHVSFTADSVDGDSLRFIRLTVRSGEENDTYTFLSDITFNADEFFSRLLKQEAAPGKANIFTKRKFTEAIGSFKVKKSGEIMFASSLLPANQNGNLTYTLNRTISYDINSVNNNLGNFGPLCDNFCSISNCGLCIRWHKKQQVIPNNTIAKPLNIKPCEKRSLEDIIRRLDTRFAELKTKVLEQLRAEYMTSCGNLLAVNDKLTISYNDSYHHYTLYDYDRAGNLVRTVPPKGVDIDPARDRTTLPNHTFVTHYEYDAKGRLIRSLTPDGSESWFGYDNAGRLVFSQTAEQRSPTNLGVERYTLTLYDDQSRIKSVQEIVKGESTPWWTSFDGKSLTNSTTPTNFLHYAAQMSSPDRIIPGDINSPQQQIVTFYSDNDNSAGRGIDNSTTQQKNLRNRVSKAINYNAPGAGSLDDVITRYSYDASGNVASVEHELPGLSAAGNAERISYDYDLLSKKVNMVKVRDGKKDRFYQRYIYDQDNRLKYVESSPDTINWDRDVSYQYYKHGPLKRMVMGEDSVQGIDYVYTINGWTKGINHPSIYRDAGTPANMYPHDPGRDGAVPSTVSTRIPNDVFGMMLGYYENDYIRGSSSFSETSSAMKPGNVGTIELYNGNIAWWTHRGTANNPTFDVGNLNNMPLVSVFTYDKLNRLRDDVTGRFTLQLGGVWGNWTVLGNSLHNSYTYDANGNITTLNRWNAGGTQFDQQQYQYYSTTAGMNRLKKITDNMSYSANDNSDIDHQSNTTNYYYEKNGNLRQDLDEDIELEWTLSGKVRKVKKYSTGTDKLEFTYDAMGNRIRKRVIDASGMILVKDVFYTYGPDGKLMQTTEKSGMGAITSVEYPIYGVSRLGLYKNTTPNRANEVTDIMIFPRYTSRRYYEVNDHLGNVRAVVGDVKDWHSNNSGEFSARVSNISNYYPFGMAQPGRMYNTGDYRYGYNGKEEDNEVKGGDGKSLDYGARWYDSRVARWMSADTKENEMPEWSTYSCDFNNPIKFIDLDGQVPTPEEAARMASHVYGSKKSSILIGGWRVSTQNFGIKLVDETGLHSQIYERVIDGKVTEYVYATAGTEDLVDVKADLIQPLGGSEQYSHAAKNAQRLSEKLGKAELTFTGHSLGGGEAAYNAMVTGRKAITFNAAGVGKLLGLFEETRTPLPGGIESWGDDIDAYILLTDPLNFLQNKHPLMPDVNGTRHYLFPTDFNSVINGHVMDNVLKSMGVDEPAQYDKDTNAPAM